MTSMDAAVVMPPRRPPMALRSREALLPNTDCLGMVNAFMIQSEMGSGVGV